MIIDRLIGIGLFVLEAEDLRNLDSNWDIWNLDRSRCEMREKVVV